MVSKRRNSFVHIDNPLFVILLFISVVIIWLLCWYFVSTFISSLSERGQFGDMFGAVNALFSGLALAGIIYSILFQQKEFREQSKIFILQRFDDTFFNLINLNKSQRDGLVSSHSVKQQNVFDYLYGIVKHNVSTLNFGTIENARIKQIIKDAFDHHAQRAEYDSYFNTLTILIKEVNAKTELELIDKIKYLSIIRSQMTESEFGLALHKSLLVNSADWIFYKAGFFSVGELNNHVNKNIHHLFKEPTFFLAESPFQDSAKW